ncbi:DUF6953 family protein [Sinorhizobium fredii]|uniref:DUF6953 family protein n=1 Tax=Rhizobium fredii TaxID=380 RepID=UPI0004B74123
MTAKASEVAAWMMDALAADGTLYQDVAASSVADRFGQDFLVINANGNFGLSKAVLAAFNKLSGDNVVWSKSERCWRFRQDYDLPGRQQP